jgi:hypothetical protein
METKPGETSAVSKAGEDQFVCGYGDETCQRNGQSVAMK